MRCLSLVRTGITSLANATPRQVPPGYGPARLRAAYGLPSSAGSGQTVAIVDAYDDPAAAANLATYRSHYKLPPCTTASGCFRKINEHGKASPLPAASGSTGWATEESLDIDMVSAICPRCHIILVEADSADMSDLGTGVNSAVSLGAKFISNSYGGSEYASETTDDSAYFNHPGVAITVSAGDSGFGPSFPAVSRYVTSVGGTSLISASGSRSWTEAVWSGSGSGCSAYEAKPAWQADTGCLNRTDNDVAAVADPDTGVAVYDTYDQGGWLELGGTSVSSPIIAGVYALAGAPAAGTYPSRYPYLHTSSLYDVVSGNDGSCSPSYLCTAAAGFNGPTGWGTPHGVAAFTDRNTVTVSGPGKQTTGLGTTVSLQIHASDSGSGQTLTYAARGLPAGVAINPTSGLITGTVGAIGNSTVSVTVTDSTHASGTATFNWVVDAVGPIASGIAGKCVDDFRDGTANSNKIDLASCNGTAAQEWTVEPDGTLRINGRCMNIAGASTANRAKIQLWSCTPGANQKWVARAVGTLVNPHSAKCLDHPGPSTVDGTQLQIRTCTGDTNQIWILP
jgi:subtilase family serine protease